MIARLICEFKGHDWELVRTETGGDLSCKRCSAAVENHYTAPPSVRDDAGRVVSDSVSK